jgi:hypothetical protein
MSAQKYFGLTINQLRVRVGLTDTDAGKDAEIDLAFATAVDILEVYLDRKLRLGSYVENKIHFFGTAISLAAYPLAIDPTTSAPMVALSPSKGFHADPGTGFIHLDGYTWEHKIEVRYDGGYDTLPPMLMIAFLAVFDSAWGTMFEGGVTGAGVVSRITVPDVGTISYDTGVSGGASDAGLIPAGVVSMIQPYRRRLV